VLMRFIALCPFIGMSTDEDKSVGMGLAVMFVTVMATSVTWPLYKFILEPLGLVFLQILVFILIIASLVQLVEFYLKKVIPSLYGAMGIYLALITTNCAILAVTFDVISKGYTFVESIPAFLKGTPILFAAAALLSIAFMGFKGLVQ
jgi:Na+-translocating ferredoxin:NAD+ oxidoreductase subunit A